jgi:hypothetical protein
VYNTDEFEEEHAASFVLYVPDVLKTLVMLITPLLLPSTKLGCTLFFLFLERIWDTR